MLERAAIRHAHTLRFDFDEIEADRSVVMRNLKPWRVFVSHSRPVNRTFQAMREIRIASGYGQVVLDPPRHLDRGELPLVGHVAIMHRMIGQREAPAGIDRANPARTMEALRPRLPLLHLDLRQMVAARLIEIRVSARVLVDFELIRQLALAAHRRQRRAFRVRRLRRILVVERARRERHALQRARTRPLRERVGFAGRVAAIKAHGFRRQRGERLQVVGDHERMRLAVVGLLPCAVEPFALHQSVHEVPVRFALPRVRTVRQRLRQRKAETPACFRVHSKHVGNDFLDVLVDPDLLVAAEPEHMHPGTQLKLIGRQAAVRAQPTRGIEIAADRPVRIVLELNPERRRLSDQLLEFKTVIVRYDIECE
ncbi:hypothetical protein BCO23253_07543 [Burkholderia contaminans]|nr:hypothetical protein BCO23253_07543 [Burkholderia contaminans]